MELRERLDLFQDMVQSCHNLYLWEYDRELVLIRSNCPLESTLHNLFLLRGAREFLLDYAMQHSKPIIMTSALGMMWAAIPEKNDGELRHVHILGPFFISDHSPQVLQERLSSLSLSMDMRRDMLRFLRELPVISLSRVYEYTIMLYYCITGQKISISDMHYQESESASPAAPRGQTADAHGTYEMEQEMVRMVREGDLNIQSHINRMAMTGSMGILADGDGMRQMKNAVLVCIVLFSRAAIEGGLSPEISMTLTDHYFQSVEACRSLQELRETAGTMQNDFVQRVHRVRSRTLSKPVMDCCDYINLHLNENLSLKKLAAHLNYSETYLSRKFRAETGRSFKEYIRAQRLAQAKALLADSSLDIREISDRLCFCSPSYFSEQFKAEFGISPTQWRETMPPPR